MGGMDTTSPTASPPSRSLRRLLIATFAAVLALVALAPGSPAGAVPPGGVNIISSIGYDQPGPNGYHKIDWAMPTVPQGKPVDQVEIERWNFEKTEKFVTFSQPDEDGPTRYFFNVPDATTFQYRVRAHNTDGWGGWGDWETSRTFVNSTHLQPYTNAVEFTQRQFQDFAGRAPTPSELGGWSTSLQDTEDVVAFVNSFAGHQKRIPRPQVIRLYMAYFLRAPEPAGLDYWADQMATGKTTVTKMSEFFAKSNEFKTLYGNKTNGQFVTLVYQNVLDRNPSPADLTYWKGQLDQKKITRGKLMIHFSESAENKALVKGEVVVIDIWTTVLREVPGDANLATYARHVDGGGTGGDIALMLFPLGSYPLV